MTKQRTTGLWTRTAQAIGKFFAEMVSLPDERRHPATRTAAWTDYPRFPSF